MGSSIEILELKDLERECTLARIRLTLAQHDPSTAAVAGKFIIIFGTPTCNIHVTYSVCEVVVEAS